MRNKFQCQLDRLRFPGTAAALCLSLSACCNSCFALARICPRPPMIDGRVMNLIKAIRQRWQHVIAHGNKMVEILDDLSVRNEREHCCGYCNEVSFSAREGHFYSQLWGNWMTSRYALWRQKDCPRCGDCLSHCLLTFFVILATIRALKFALQMRAVLHL